MQITDLTPQDNSALRQAAALLVAAFRENWPDSWPDLDSALREVEETFAEDHISRIAIGDDNLVLGWIGAAKQYNGHVWELHPLVVHPDHQHKGVGQALVADLENQVRSRGGLTLWLGTDDENNMTSLGGKNLYPNVLEHLTNIQNLGGHPYEFYQKLGFTLVGVLPNANGPGKPDIFMAKSIR